MIEHRIGKCLYRLEDSTPLPKPRRYHKKKFKPLASTMFAVDAQMLKYLQWIYPDHKLLQKATANTHMKKLKDPDAGKVRWVEFGKTNTFKIEIPHWDFNPNILEDTCLLS